jgi:mannose-6-phosphate isomerase
MDPKTLAAQRIRQPLIPQANNFTPRERTPWGGTKIARIYKKWLGLPPNQIVGESWEISGHPAFPNRFVWQVGNDRMELTLPELLSWFPNEILGKAIAGKFKNRIPLLIKLLDTAENLSVQVHPNDFYPRLKPGEMGKTEAWYIVAAEPGSGLYLGLQPKVTRDQLRAAIEHQADVSQFLNFVPVQPGDTFFIPAGTIHAIGRGITLIEPQQTSETTYRFWDWNRRYDETGTLSPTGKPRALHIEDSFAVTHFDSARGEAFVAAIKGRPQLVFSDEGNDNFLLLSTAQFAIEKTMLKNSRPLFILKEDFFQTLTVIQGVVKLKTTNESGAIENVIPAGQSVLIPACVSNFELEKVGMDVAEIIKVYYPIEN